MNANVYIVGSDLWLWHTDVHSSIFYTDILLDDFLVAENSSFQSEVNSPVSTSEKSPSVTSPRAFHANTTSFGVSPSLDGESEIPSSSGLRYP